MTFSEIPYALKPGMRQEYPGQVIFACRYGKGLDMANLGMRAAPRGLPRKGQAGQGNQGYR